MSTATPAQQRTVAVPTPRASVDPPVAAPAARGTAPAAAGRPGLFDRHAWLVPVLGVGCVVAVFVSMVLLTWAAGGGTPFDR